MNKTVTGIIIGIIIIIGGGFLLSQYISQPSTPSGTNIPAVTTTPTTNPKPTSAPTANPTPKAGQYTLAEVAKHPNSSSCWTAINGGVYDLTAWISQHPGGEGAILSVCGRDGTAAFDGQHGGSSRQASLLATFKIGVLVN